MTYVTCRMTAKNRDQLRNSYARQSSVGYLYLFFTFLLYTPHYVCHRIIIHCLLISLSSFICFRS